MARKHTREEFLRKAEEKSPALDCSESAYENNNTKISVRCRKCGNMFNILPRSLLSGVGCPECNGGVRKPAGYFTGKAAKIHRSRYDYSKVIYKNSKEKVCIICPEHGEFWQRPSNHLLGHGCPMCGNSSGEREICGLLEDSGFTLNETYFTQKTFEGLADKEPLRYDFYIPSESLLVEFNGLQHYRFPNLFHKNYHDFLVQKHHDWLKRRYAEKHGIRLLIIPYPEKDRLWEIILSNISTGRADRPRDPQEPPGNS